MYPTPDCDSMATDMAVHVLSFVTADLPKDDPVRGST